MAGSGRSRRWISASSTSEPAVSASAASSAIEFSASLDGAVGPDADEHDPLEPQLAVLDLGDVLEFGREPGDPAQGLAVDAVELVAVVVERRRRARRGAVRLSSVPGSHESGRRHERDSCARPRTSPVVEHVRTARQVADAGLGVRGEEARGAGRPRRRAPPGRTARPARRRGAGPAAGHRGRRRSTRRSRRRRRPAAPRRRPRRTHPVPHERVSPEPRSWTRIATWRGPRSTTNSTLTPSGTRRAG